MSTAVASQAEAVESFTREELWALREKALAQIHPDGNEGWNRAYRRLADAANILDAFFGRSSVCRTCHPVTLSADCNPDQVPESVPPRAIGNSA